MTIFQHNGWCPTCEESVIFSASHQWFRDHLLCSSCGSIPRERALFKVIVDFFQTIAIFVFTNHHLAGAVPALSSIKSVRATLLRNFIPTSLLVRLTRKVVIVVRT